MSRRSKSRRGALRASRRLRTPKLENYYLKGEAPEFMKVLAESAVLDDDETGPLKGACNVSLS